MLAEPNYYEDGYSTGLTWRYDWIPGGPFVPNRPCASPQNNSYRLRAYEEMVKNNKDWLQGFNDGRLANLLGEPKC